MNLTNIDKLNLNSYANLREVCLIYRIWSHDSRLLLSEGAVNILRTETTGIHLIGYFEVKTLDKIKVSFCCRISHSERLNNSLAAERTLMVRTVQFSTKVSHWVRKSMLSVL